MTNAQIQALATAIALGVVNALNSSKAVKPTVNHKPRSTYRPANKFTPKGKISSEGLTVRQVGNDVAVAKAFKKQGLLVTPRVDACTFKEWQKKGFTVKSGQHGIFVKRVGTLFHSGQVAASQPISLVTGKPVELVIA